MNLHEECPHCLRAAGALVELRAILKTEGLFLDFAHDKKLRAIKPLLYVAMDAVGADIHRDYPSSIPADIAKHLREATPC